MLYTIANHCGNMRCCRSANRCRNWCRIGICIRSKYRCCRRRLLEICSRGSIARRRGRRTRRICGCACNCCSYGNCGSIYISDRPFDYTSIRRVAHCRLCLQCKFFYIMARQHLEKTQETLSKQQVKYLFYKANEYGVKITGDLSGHIGTNWPMPHIHLGDARIHVAVAQEAIGWISKHLQ